MNWLFDIFFSEVFSFKYLANFSIGLSLLMVGFFNIVWIGVFYWLNALQISFSTLWLVFCLLFKSCPLRKEFLV